MQKIITYVVLAVFIIGGIVIFATNTNKSSLNQTSAGSETTNPTAGTPVPVTDGSTSKTYSIAEVAKHSTQVDCWTAVNGNVYNVTSWISQHPGGAQAILSMCGKDGSAAFNDQHGGQRRPANELATFLVGTLK